MCICVYLHTRTHTCVYTQTWDRSLNCPGGACHASVISGPPGAPGAALLDRPRLLRQASCWSQGGRVRVPSSWALVGRVDAAPQGLAFGPPRRFVSPPCLGIGQGVWGTMGLCSAGPQWVAPRGAASGWAARPRGGFRGGLGKVSGEALVEALGRL